MQYDELIRAVFSNRHGSELLEAWQKMYGDQVSFVEGVSSEGVAYNEGHRAFYLMIKAIVEDVK